MVPFGVQGYLVGGFKNFLFSPLFGEDFQFYEYFSDGLVQPQPDIIAPFKVILATIGPFSMPLPEVSHPLQGEKGTGPSLTV